MQFGTINIVIFLVISSISPTTSSSSGGDRSLRGKSSREIDGGSPYLLPLHRETVPVFQNGQVISQKTAYSGKISIGGPVGQEFSVVFDTGSGMVVLPSLDCEDKVCLDHHRYNITNSPKAWPVNADGEKVPDDEDCDQATIGYGTGSVTGEFVHDRICLGPPQAKQSNAAAAVETVTQKKEDNQVCTTVNMVVAVEMSAQPFESFKFDGIFGLGLESLALTSQFSFFSQLSTGTKKSARFGFYLNGEHSEIAMGGHNDARLLGPLSWAPVATPKLGFWNIKIRSVRIGNQEIADCKKGGCKGILDTGTSHLGVPAHAMQTVTDLLTKDVAGASDCRSVAAPTMSIDINGFTITLGPEDYMQSASPSNAIAPPEATQDATGTSGTALVAKQDAASQLHCQPRVMPVDMKNLGPNLFILGEPVLHRYYTVYDWHKKQVGFGLANTERNQLRSGDAATPTPEKTTATATIAVEALDALEGEDEEIYLMQMSVSVTLCDEGEPIVGTHTEL
jgi:hypothetical protein